MRFRDADSAPERHDAGEYGDAFLDYLDERYSIVSASGGNQVKLEGGACPFCGDDRSDLRLYVNAKTGFGQCFHCGRGFSPLSFVKASEGCSGRVAKSILKGAGDGWAKGEEEKEEEVGLITPPMCWAQDSPEAMAYLADREIPLGVAQHFRLRYALDNIEIGGRLFYTKGRLIIPIFGMDGEMMSWQGRDISGKAKQRYLFPPGFKGREYVYNAHAIARDCCLILVEGAFDAYGWFRAGFKNVVATFGKKLSEEQLDIIRSLKPKVVFVAWDSDADWLKFELIERCTHLFEMRIVDLGGRDADELNKEALTDALARASEYNWNDKILRALNLPT